MNQADIIGIVQEAIYMVISVSMPLLAIGLLIGVAVSIFQATTQINEQALSFVPKLVAVFFTFALCLPWMLNTLIDFANRLYSRINAIIR